LRKTELNFARMRLRPAQPQNFGRAGVN